MAGAGALSSLLITAVAGHLHGMVADCRRVDHDCHLTEFEKNIHAAILSQARHGLTADEFSALQCEGSQLLLERAVSLGRAIADEKGEKSGQR